MDDVSTEHDGKLLPAGDLFAPLRPLPVQDSRGDNALGRIPPDVRDRLLYGLEAGVCGQHARGPRVRGSQRDEPMAAASQLQDGPARKQLGRAHHHLGEQHGGGPDEEGHGRPLPHEKVAGLPQAERHAHRPEPGACVLRPLIQGQRAGRRGGVQLQLYDALGAGPPLGVRGARETENRFRRLLHGRAQAAGVCDVRARQGAQAARDGRAGGLQGCPQRVLRTHVLHQQNDPAQRALQLLVRPCSKQALYCSAAWVISAIEGRVWKRRGGGQTQGHLRSANA
mmetsp:Transcript_100877/g.300916  ORF Transcript_100877/g.300916 Transcript_100877/m.300916 type:complete len:282 (+) Transcript_100877:334-1179(+)